MHLRQLSKVFITGCITLSLIIFSGFLSSDAIASTTEEANLGKTSDTCHFVGEPSFSRDQEGDIVITPPTVKIDAAGDCSFTTPPFPSKEDLQIKKAIVQLEPAGTGMVDDLYITKLNQDGSRTRIYGCSLAKVESGTDLNVKCDTPRLPENPSLVYAAVLKDFSPGTAFSVNLYARPY